ncbi:hypothetical protein JCM11641_005701 [Rhodosporidiobolus odoratus]
MLTSTTLPLALAATLASSAAAHYVPAPHGHIGRSHLSHRSFVPARAALEKRKSRHARRGADPESAMPGTLLSSEGCTKFAHVTSGDWCSTVIGHYDGLTLDEFYSMNEQIDKDCQNLWAGYDVCVSRTAKAASTSGSSETKPAEAAKLTREAIASTPAASISSSTTHRIHKAHKTSSASSSASSSSSSSEAPATSSAQAVKAPVKVAAVQTTTSYTTAAPTSSAVKSSSTTTTTTSSTTTSKAPVTTSATSADDDGDDDDWVCEGDEDYEEDDSSSSSTWTSSAWTTSVAPKTNAYVASTTTTSAWVAPSSSSAPAKSSSAASAQTTKVADTSSLSVLAASGIKGFLGDNGNAILSWYNTNAGQDSTNGCGFPYDNNVPGFAPSLKTMMSNFGYDYERAATAYCGLEAVVSTPDGKSMTLYIADAFDDTWVRTPASLDIIKGSFSSLFGKSTDNKNDVVTGATWKLTGKRNSKYAFKSTTSLS